MSEQHILGIVMIAVGVAILIANKLSKKKDKKDDFERLGKY
ncbi:MAG: hypothetical protein U0K95_05895 [Eubacterium sp.]|nr:hypothetical protein [Eubacterium sp.]